MSRYVLSVLLILASLPVGARAQSSATVAGRVLDMANAAPIGYATVVIENAATGAGLSGALAGEDGRFVVQGLAPGTYKFRVTFPGFLEAEADVLVSPLNNTYDLGDIRLPRIEGYTEDVKVTADTIRLAGIDTQVFRLDDGPAQSTGTALDAMKNLPGVTIDEEGRVSLRGSDQVAILIDGRQSSLTGFGSQRGLDGVSAANIEAIEIINNPSARFDAAGMAGIINIIYRKEQQLGWSGDVGFSLGVGQFTRQRRDLPTDLGSFTNNEKITPSANLNYRTPRTRTFMQGELMVQDDLPNNEFTTRFYDDGRVLESQVPENREQYIYTVRLGSDFTVNDRNTITASGVHNYEHHIDVAQVPFILQQTGQRERFWFWREDEGTGFTNANVDFTHRFVQPGHELGVNLQYTRGKEDEAYFLNEESRIRVGTDDTHIVAIENTLPLSIDYTRPLPTGRLEIGTKLQRRWIPVTYTVRRGVQSVIYPGLGDFSDWDENIFAGYANLVRITPRYTLEGGVRLEETQVSYVIPRENIYYPGSDEYDYFGVFPNAKLTVNLSPSNRVTAAYNRRVDRPGEPELRIFPKYDDPEILKVGNPFLRPQFTNAYEGGVSHSWRGGSGSATVYRRDVTDAFMRIFAIDDSNPNYDIVNRIFENAGNFRQTGVLVTASHEIVPAWRLTGSANWFHNDIDPLQTTLFFPTRRPFSLPGSTDNTWDLTINNRFPLPGAVELQANYIRYASRNVAQGRERARSSVDVSARKALMNERAELVFTFTDIFNDFALQHEIQGRGFTALYQNFLETQVATVGIRYRF
ncbi:MAG: TonB-dependent receptor [Acidobacteria bacterium]|nr:TonB-dependent receptor [Acidobacteriota bacterium]